MKSMLHPSALALIALAGATAARAEIIGYDGFGFRDGANETEGAVNDVNVAINHIPAAGITAIGIPAAAAIGIPTKTGRRYWLERSAAMTPGTWSDSGLPPLIGNGTPQTFYTEKPASTHFFRVRYGP